MAPSDLPGRDCAVCPRLAAFRDENRRRHPDFFNAPVPPFGDDAHPDLVIVGLAPGLKGANRTGRPFTGDYAGDLLYGTLADYGWSTGRFRADPADGLALTRAYLTNAVKCVPPENKPTPAEIKACGRFLGAELAERAGVRAILALGHIAHNAVLSAKGLVRSRYAFKHGGRHALPGGAVLFDSYHCSRYNTNTGVLTADMFRAVFADIAAFLKQA